MWLHVNHISGKVRQPNADVPSIEPRPLIMQQEAKYSESSPAPPLVRPSPVRRPPILKLPRFALRTFCRLGRQLLLSLQVRRRRVQHHRRRRPVLVFVHRPQLVLDRLDLSLDGEHRRRGLRTVSGQLWQTGSGLLGGRRHLVTFFQLGVLDHEPARQRHLSVELRHKRLRLVRGGECHEAVAARLALLGPGAVVDEVKAADVDVIPLEEFQHGVLGDAEVEVADPQATVVALVDRRQAGDRGRTRLRFGVHDAVSRTVSSTKALREQLAARLVPANPNCKHI